MSGSGLSGPIPRELGALTNLTELHLVSNRLTGEISPQLGELSNLRKLGPRRQPAKPEIFPTELSKLSNLEHLDLALNRLTGEIPAGLANLANLTHLYLAGNQLTGCIPIGLEVVLVNDLHSLDLFSCGAGGPDLVVEVLQTLGLSSDRVASPGALISVVAEVHNRGDTPSAATLLRYYVFRRCIFLICRC